MTGRELLRLASQLAERGEPFAIATVVDRRAPTSSHAGDMGIVTGAAAFHGFVGGSCTRPTVVEQALAALSDGQPRLIVLSPDPHDRNHGSATVFPMTCHSGGSVEIHIQPVLPAPLLLVYGLTPAARALVRLGAAMGYRVWAVDPAADRADLPAAEAVFTDPGALTPPSGGERLAVVATQGEWDEEAVLAALVHAPTYLGVVVSARRAEELRAFLEKKVPEAQRPGLEGLHAPAGLHIGAQRGEEIALSILAEIVERRAAARASAPKAAPPQESAVDPVCGMTVATATARHRAEHGGRTYYFCCGGCREKFASHAERFVQA
jgi:xanthine dehydrogenase accessory factor